MTDPRPVRPSEPQPEREPTHPTLVAGLMMLGVTLFLVLVATLTAVY